jgi:DMSO/TMAO reductase YedYZ molybdopterin-dependent catalytic subunit
MSLLERLGDRVAEADEPRRPPSPPIPAAGPFRRDFWRSPLRGRWLTSFLGSTLLPFVIVAALTGFLSHAAYNPGLGSNDVSGGFEVDLYFFDWPAAPAWLYSLTQSLHLLAGFAAIPILLAKLWSVIPKLFERPATRSVAHALERLSLLTLVGSALFLFVSGVINVQYWLPFGFSFVPAHYYAALIFVAALAVHLVLKLPVVARTFRREGAFRPLGEGIERMRVADAREDDLASPAPAAPTISRRGMLGAVALGSAGLLTMTAGSNLLGSVRGIALLSPRGQDYGDGPNDFQVNKTAAYAGIDPARTGGSWRLGLTGAGGDINLTRADLLAMPQHAERLPIACVEGWTTWQDWQGVRLADLAALAGVDATSGGTVLVESLQEAGAFAQATLASNQIFDPRSLLALRVNGADLSLDHGYPARVIVPALPGVHNTKWARRMTFMPA